MRSFLILGHLVTAAMIEPPLPDLPAQQSPESQGQGAAGTTADQPGEPVHLLANPFSMVRRSGSPKD